MNITLKFLLESNKIVITHDTYYHIDPNLLFICLKYNNIIYNYSVKGGGCNYVLYYKAGYVYYKDFFYLYYGSYFRLYKNHLKKCCNVLIKNIKYIKYNIIYSLFIYNKYYTYTNNKLYRHMKSITITSYKLFNCRDFYKIYSYI